MLSLLVAHWSEALSDPRASARRILRAQPTPGEAVAMAVAGFALGYLALRLAEIGLGRTVTEALEPLSEPTAAASSAPAAAQVSAMGLLVTGLLLALAQFVIVAVLGWRLGALAGGSARFEQMLGVVGWHALATAPLDVAAKTVLIMSSPGLAAVGLIVVAAAGFYVIYLLAAFVAEAHSFESSGQVLIAMIGVMIMFMLLAAIFSGAGPG
ncbi:MAG: YIP1 family protein [Pseudomonadota bacterium]